MTAQTSSKKSTSAVADRSQNLYQIVQHGLVLLKTEKGYLQSNVVQKLVTLEKKVSAPSLSNIVNNKNVGIKILMTASDGVRSIIKMELGKEYNEKSQTYIPLPKTSKWHPQVVRESNAKDNNQDGFVYHFDGRLSIEEKASYIANAQKEVVEVGIRLKSFSEYFFSRKESEYKSYIINLLKRGVAIKGYMLDPDSQEASIYFTDRAKVQHSESESLDEMRRIKKRLSQLMHEFKHASYPGTFEIYLYRHIPYNLFILVDGQTAHGKMMVSHYMYGIRRAECPVLEFTKSQHPALFRKYLDSMKYCMKDARLLS